jgi:hypothetical protein
MIAIVMMGFYSSLEVTSMSKGLVDELTLISTPQNNALCVQQYVNVKETR